MTLKLHQKYDLGGTQYAIRGDGATWIREGAGYSGGRYQLCRYHLNRALCHAVGHDRTTLLPVQYHCGRGEHDAALKQLREVANRESGGKVKDIRRIIKYISSNASGLKDYREYIDHKDNTLRRTGAIEGNIDKLIVRRMKNHGMSWSRQGIRRMLWLRISVREGTLANRLQSCSDKTSLVKMPERQIRRVLDRTIKYDYTNYFNAEMPALSGPHASHPWIEILKSLTRIAI